MIYTAVIQNGFEKALLFDASTGSLWEIATDSGEMVRHLNFQHSLVASMDADIVSINLKQNSYETLISGDRSKFYPSLRGSTLYFSEPTIAVTGTFNPGQRRALFALDLPTGQRQRMINGIVSYQVGRPFLGPTCLAIDFIVPIDEEWSANEAVENLNIGENDGNYTVCIPNERLTSRIALEELERMKLLPGQPSVEQVSIDRNFQTAVYYTLSPTPGWIAVDLVTARPIIYLPGAHQSRYFVSSNGTHIAGTHLSHTSLEITVHSLPSLGDSVAVSYNGKAARRTLGRF